MPMPDPRFYERLAASSTGELAALAGASRLGDDDKMIAGVATLDRAQSADVSYCADRKFLQALGETSAGACFVSPAHSTALPSGCVALVTSTPQAAYAAAAERLVRPRAMNPDVAQIDPSAEIEDGAVIHVGAIIGPGAQIGRGSVVGPGAVVGPGVAIGRDCQIGPRVVIGFALIGDRVKIYAGAVIGEPGFGAAGSVKGVIDLPQLGRVILQDGVTVGANSCIDRGAFEDTVIGENTKIDNLVQIGHNVLIGRNCVLAAHVGVSGSAVIGDGCQLGGRVGLADHITIGAGARLAAAAGVMNNVPAGETWGGFPAKPMLRWMRETAWLSREAVKNPRRGEGK